MDVDAFNRLYGYYERHVFDVAERETTMSVPTRALWCDFGKHSFSENDEWKAITMSGSGSKGARNITVDVTWTACMLHIPGVPAELVAAVEGMVEPE